jgi:putative restriction endonuclease
VNEPVKNPGDINRNQQQLLRITQIRGNDYNSRVWILKCRNCSYIYGSNNTDAFQRKCPKCERGKKGLPVPAEHHGEDWTYDEHVIAFNFYNRIPFGRIHINNPQVRELAALLGRKVGSASRKLANFARLDPTLRERKIRGLEHGAKGEERVWEAFAEHPGELALHSARLLAARSGCSLEQLTKVETDDLPPPGVEREALVKLRVNQSFFRERVLSAYEFRCCVTGLTAQPLLVASHIVPWAEDTTHRLNPRNGLCLNALHDRLFDRHLMWIDSSFRVRLPEHLCDVDEPSKQTVDWLLSFDRKPLLLPKKFRPDAGFLAKHAERCRQTSTRTVDSDY